MDTRSDHRQPTGSRQAIRDALLRLLAMMPYQDVTVSQICREAGVLRQSFYRHFELKEDILAYHMDSLFEEYFATLYEARGESSAQLCAFYRFMERNRPFLHMALQNQLFHLIDRSIAKNLPRFVSIGQIAVVEEERAENYLMRFISATVCALLAQWVSNGFAESPEWMARLTERLWTGLHARA